MRSPQREHHVEGDSEMLDKGLTCVSSIWIRLCTAAPLQPRTAAVLVCGHRPLDVLIPAGHRQEGDKGGGVKDASSV